MQPGIVFISGDNLNNINKKLTIFPFNYNSQSKPLRVSLNRLRLKVFY